MTQPAKSQEPSMEEILASIRRIIADDDATKTSRPPKWRTPSSSAAAGAPPRACRRQRRPAQRRRRCRRNERRHIEPAAPTRSESCRTDGADSDILDLTECWLRRRPRRPAPAPASGFRTIDAQADVFFDDEPAPAPAPSDASSRNPPPRGRRTESSAMLLSTSASAAVDSAFSALASTVLTQSSRTLEDLVREMLRPMLKSWLDDNLPGMVERLVRAEIERVSRGRNTPPDYDLPPRSAALGGGRSDERLSSRANQIASAGNAMALPRNSGAAPNRSITRRAGATPAVCPI